MIFFSVRKSNKADFIPYSIYVIFNNLLVVLGGFLSRVEIVLISKKNKLKKNASCESRTHDSLLPIITNYRLSDWYRIKIDRKMLSFVRMTYRPLNFYCFHFRHCLLKINTFSFYTLGSSTRKTFW